MTNTRSKVTAAHLARTAYLYVRQSSLRQVAENQESTRRQYALQRRAAALGWSEDQIQVIDTDLGKSGASVDGREGFQHLVAEVGLGHAGIVLGLEVSRLARNCTDWHRLLEICALTSTLILDEDGIYDPGLYNDRLLLGLKGTMSEAELHLLRARLQGGLLAKARRGELKICLPVGLVYDRTGRVVLHPDVQVRGSIALVFETFRRTGAASATLRWLHEQGLLLPTQRDKAHDSHEVLWRKPTLSRVISCLRNPRYAGAFVYGRTQTRRRADGGTRRTKLARDDWEVLLLDQHPGYLEWAEYERNLAQLEANTPTGFDGRTPPREGPALLQGLVLCGMCGGRMSVSYHHRQGRLVPSYYCVKHASLRGSSCQSMAGTDIDEAVGQLVIDAMTPMALQLSLAVQDELQARMDEAERLRQMAVQRAEHEADLARQRYMAVDPRNRLVASSLEADWNRALRHLEQARDDAERQRLADAAHLDQATRERITALATDFPAVWSAPETPQRERKRMLALLVEDVTLLRGEQLTAHVRFRGGATSTLTVSLPTMSCDTRRTSARVVAEADTLLAAHTDGEVAEILNQRGRTTGAGQAFDGPAVAWVRKVYQLQSLKEHLLEAGGITGVDLAARLGVTPSQLRYMARTRQLLATVCNDKGERIYAPVPRQPESIQRLLASRERLPESSPAPHPAPPVHATHVRGAV